MKEEIDQLARKLFKPYAEELEFYKRDWDVFLTRLSDVVRAARDDETKDLIEWLEKEKTDSLWVGEDPETEEMTLMDPDQLWGEDMSFAYNLALDNVVSHLKSQLED
jgi:hypothetical protein